MTDECDDYFGEQFEKEFHERRSDYEESLGKFLVAFNRIEQCTFEIVATAFQLKGLIALSDKTREVFKNLNACRDVLAHLMTDIDDLGGINLERIKQLAQDRNDYAHGAFLHELKDGQSKYVVRGKKLREADPETLYQLARDSDDLAEDMERLLISLRIKAVHALYQGKR